MTRNIQENLKTRLCWQVVDCIHTMKKSTYLKKKKKNDVGSNPREQNARRVPARDKWSGDPSETTDTFRGRKGEGVKKSATNKKKRQRETKGVSADSRLYVYILFVRIRDN